MSLLTFLDLYLQNLLHYSPLQTGRRLLRRWCAAAPRQLINVALARASVEAVADNVLPFSGRACGDLQNMALLGWLWLASPFAVIALISHDAQLLALVSTHHRRCQAAGWSGAAIMLLGVTLVPGTAGSIMFVIGTPVVGLAVWARGDDGDDGGEQPPDVPPIDWGEFERSFWAHVRSRSGPSRRPRTPSPR